MVTAVAWRVQWAAGSTWSCRGLRWGEVKWDPEPSQCISVGVMIMALPAVCLNGFQRLPFLNNGNICFSFLLMLTNACWDSRRTIIRCSAELGEVVICTPSGFNLNGHFSPIKWVGEHLWTSPSPNGSHCSNEHAHGALMHGSSPAVHMPHQQCALVDLCCFRTLTKRSNFDEVCWQAGLMLVAQCVRGVHLCFGSCDNYLRSILAHFVIISIST